MASPQRCAGSFSRYTDHQKHSISIRFSRSSACARRRETSSGDYSFRDHGVGFARRRTKSNDRTCGVPPHSLARSARSDVGGMICTNSELHKLQSFCQNGDVRSDAENMQHANQKAHKCGFEMPWIRPGRWDDASLGSCFLCMTSLACLSFSEQVKATSTSFVSLLYKGRKSQTATRSMSSCGETSLLLSLSTVAVDLLRGNEASAPKLYA